MSDKELEIFNLCERLAELLGDKEAIADLQTLLERHPEMFKDKQEVKRLIEKVISEPEIIIKNPTPMSEKDYIAGKKLNEKKMGEVGIRKDENISKIFHANEKRLKNLELMAKKDIVADGRDAHTPYTQAQSLDGRLVENNISSTANVIIAQPKEQAKQNPIQSQANFEANIFSNLSPAERLTQLQRNQEVISQMPKASEILNHQESTNDLASLERNSHQDSKESTLKHQYKRMLK